MKRLSTVWEDLEYNHFVSTVVKPGIDFQIFCDRCFEEIWHSQEWRHDRKTCSPGCAAIFALERRRQLEAGEHVMGENAGARNIRENRKHEREEREQERRTKAARRAEWEKRIIYPQKCKAITWGGSQCRCYPTHGKIYCDLHKGYKPEDDSNLDDPRE